MASLQLTLITGNPLNQDYTFNFSTYGGAIGRSTDCDWTLDDSERYISKKHILIAFIDNAFVLTDVSSNGVFINHSQTPIGKGNTCRLALNDQITLGKFGIKVTQLLLQSPTSIPSADSPTILSTEQSNIEPDLNNGLLGLVNNTDSSNATENKDAPAPESLGLFDILSNNIQPPPEQQFNYKSTNEPKTSSTPSTGEILKPTLSSVHSVNNNQIDNNPKQAHSLNETPSACTIPDNWDFDDLSLNEPNNNIPPAPTPHVPPKPIAPNTISQNQSINALEETNAKAELINANLSLSSRVNEESAKSTDNLDAQVTKANPAEQLIVTPPYQEATKEDFFQLLYEKLNLPKESMTSVDQTQFANDLANVLTASTQGIMALLAGRSVFKQESRLEMTMIKPQSNNPIKFSLDPSDTLEMLLVKKKPGYMSAKDAYAEALHDAQLHQMAFLSGLQATLDGLLCELSPSAIEQEIDNKGTGFLGLKAGSQKWQTFVEKQERLHKQVSENLNDILSRHFSAAYEKHINDSNNKHQGLLHD